MKIAAIDIGSNSVRLMLWADGKTLYKKIATTRLGEGLISTGAMSGQAIARTAQAVAAFRREGEEQGAKTVLAFATAAVRSASNRAQFLAAVRGEAGLDVDVISGEEEARIGILGALGFGDGGIIDLGGASTEITVQREGRRLYSYSADIGTVRLFDACGRDRGALREYIGARLAQYGSVPSEGLKFYGIGGTATTIAAVYLGLESYDPAAVDGCVVPAEEIGGMADKLLSMTVEEVKKVRGMEPRRADIIGGGCLLMYSILNMLGAPELVVSERDNLEGYVLSRAGGWGQ